MADMAPNLKSITSPNQFVRTVEGMIGKRLPVDNAALLGRVIQLGGVEKSLTLDQIAGLRASFESAAQDAAGDLATNYQQNIKGLTGAFVLCGGRGQAAALKARLEIANVSNSNDPAIRVASQVMTAITGSEKWKDLAREAKYTGVDYPRETRLEIARQVLSAATLDPELGSCIDRWNGALFDTSSTLITVDGLYTNGFQEDQFDGARFASKALLRIRQLSEQLATGAHQLENHECIAEVAGLFEKASMGFDWMSKNVSPAWAELAAKYGIMARHASEILNLAVEVERRLIPKSPFENFAT